LVTAFVHPLRTATDAARVGPKAANLAALSRAGLPTPGGFCVTSRISGSVTFYGTTGKPISRRSGASPWKFA